MKRTLIVGAMSMAVGCIASHAFAGEAELRKSLTNLTNVTTKAQIMVSRYPGASPLKVISARTDPKDRGAILLSLEGGKTSEVTFHNQTEADWFMQFLVQLDASFSMSISRRIGSIAGRGFGSRVDNFYAVVMNDAKVSILVTPANDKSGQPIADDIIFDCGPKVLTTVEVAKTPKKITLDVFADLFRFGMEKNGIWFGSEGKKDKADAKEPVTCPRP